MVVWMMNTTIQMNTTRQGYDFGISLYAELMVNNDFFKEKRKSK
jgi:hypothetical protein